MEGCQQLYDTQKKKSKYLPIVKTASKLGFCLLQSTRNTWYHEELHEIKTSEQYYEVVEIESMEKEATVNDDGTAPLDTDALQAPAEVAQPLSIDHLGSKAADEYESHCPVSSHVKA